MCFLQHLNCEDFHNKQVDWDDKGTHGGVAMGCLDTKKRATPTRIKLKQTKPIFLK